MYFIKPNNTENKNVGAQDAINSTRELFNTIDMSNVDLNKIEDILKKLEKINDVSTQGKNALENLKLALIDVSVNGSNAGTTIENLHRSLDQFVVVSSRATEKMKDLFEFRNDNALDQTIKTTTKSLEQMKDEINSINRYTAETHKSLSELKKSDSLIDDQVFENTKIQMKEMIGIMDSDLQYLSKMTPKIFEDLMKEENFNGIKALINNVTKAITDANGQIEGMFNNIKNNDIFDENSTKKMQAALTEIMNGFKDVGETTKQITSGLGENFTDGIGKIKDVLTIIDNLKNSNGLLLDQTQLANLKAGESSFQEIEKIMKNLSGSNLSLYKTLLGSGEFENAQKDVVDIFKTIEEITAKAEKLHSIPNSDPMKQVYLKEFYQDSNDNFGKLFSQGSSLKNNVLGNIDDKADSEMKENYKEVVSSTDKLYHNLVKIIEQLRIASTAFDLDEQLEKANELAKNLKQESQEISATNGSLGQKEMSIGDLAKGTQGALNKVLGFGGMTLSGTALTNMALKSFEDISAQRIGLGSLYSYSGLGADAGIYQANDIWARSHAMAGETNRYITEKDYRDMYIKTARQIQPNDGDQFDNVVGQFTDVALKFEKVHGISSATTIQQFSQMYKDFGMSVHEANFNLLNMKQTSEEIGINFEKHSAAVMSIASGYLRFANAVETTDSLIKELTVSGMTAEAAKSTTGSLMQASSNVSTGASAYLGMHYGGANDAFAGIARYHSASKDDQMKMLMGWVQDMEGKGTQEYRARYGETGSEEGLRGFLGEYIKGAFKGMGVSIDAGTMQSYYQGKFDIDSVMRALDGVGATDKESLIAQEMSELNKGLSSLSDVYLNLNEQIAGSAKSFITDLTMTGDGFLSKLNNILLGTSQMAAGNPGVAGGTMVGGSILSTILGVGAVSGLLNKMPLPGPVKNAMQMGKNVSMPFLPAIGLFGASYGLDVLNDSFGDRDERGFFGQLGDDAADSGSRFLNKAGAIQFAKAVDLFKTSGTSKLLTNIGGDGLKVGGKALAQIPAIGALADIGFGLYEMNSLRKSGTADGWDYARAGLGTVGAIAGDFFGPGGGIAAELGLRGLITGIENLFKPGQEKTEADEKQTKEIEKLNDEYKLYTHSYDRVETNKEQLQKEQKEKIQSVAIETEKSNKYLEQLVKQGEKSITSGNSQEGAMAYLNAYAGYKQNLNFVTGEIDGLDKQQDQLRPELQKWNKIFNSSGKLDYKYLNEFVEKYNKDKDGRKDLLKELPEGSFPILFGNNPFSDNIHLKDTYSPVLKNALALKEKMKNEYQTSLSKESELLSEKNTIESRMRNLESRSPGLGDLYNDLYRNQSLSGLYAPRNVAQNASSSSVSNNISPSMPINITIQNMNANSVNDIENLAGIINRQVESKYLELIRQSYYNGSYMIE